MEEVGHVTEITEAETNNSQKGMEQLNVFDKIDPETHVNQDARTNGSVARNRARQRLAVAVRCLYDAAWSSKASLTPPYGFNIWFAVYVSLETKTKTGLNVLRTKWRSTSTQSPSLCETWPS